MERIYWNSRIKQEVIRHCRAAEKMCPGISPLRALETAQREMAGVEGFKRRHITAVQAVPWLVEALKTPPAPKELEVVEKFIPGDITNFSDKEIATEYVRRFGGIDKLVSSLLQETVSAELHRREAASKAPKVERVRLSKILIIGPNSDQQRDILKEHGGYFDIEFHKDENLHLVKARATGCTEVICMRFKNHAHHEIIDGVKTTFIKGGVTSVHKYLCDLEVDMLAKESQQK